MLLKSVNLYQQAGAGYELVMDFGNLPRGEYVLYIKVNDQKFSEKVSVEQTNMLYKPIRVANIMKIETMTLKVGNVTRAVSSYSYDDIGRLVSVKRSGNAGIVKYDYNIRNWLKKTKSDRFKQNLWYESTGAYPCFNGNISRMQWQTSKDNVLRGYDFAYDGSFDFKDGVDADVEYFYDTNGALIKDLNKGISNIEYDVLGNLKCITFSNGFKTKYVYDAAGNKLRTTHESVVTNTTDYIGNFIFENGKLDKYLFDGGYCSFDNNQNPTFHYYEKDHLGSVRMVVNENGTIEPSHTFGVVGYVKEFDFYFNQVVSYPVFGKNNTELEEQINIVEQ